MADDSISLSILMCDPDKYIWCLLYVRIVSCLLEHIFNPNLLLEFYFLRHCWIYLMSSKVKPLCLIVPLLLPIDLQ
jgi:hypothetical protein